MTGSEGATRFRIPAPGAAVFFLLFAVSGYSGLIYESVWSHYLKLYLGHAAYAQALVLAIFMGGMSLGAWLSAQFIGRIRNPLRAYALVEGTIGLIALVFDGIFKAATAFVLGHVFGHVESVFAAQAIKWASAALLILPQSVLLGATFPLMSNGLLRRFPDAPGNKLGMLYFTNSIGGAAGVLTSGFVLIALVGLPGTMLTAGIINVALAIVVYGLARSPGAPFAETRTTPAATDRDLPAFILIAALITGLSSFVYEIVWIRMLSMVLGTSTHAFELMLSAFITGLAIGGFIVRKRMASGREALLRAAYIQVLMGVAAFATLPLYDRGFDLMAFFMSALSHNDNGYILFVLASHGIALAAMLPATIFAGMTLPLFTAILLDRGHGERSVGQVYAFNTLGAIAGTVLTLFLLLPLLGIEHALLIGAALDVIVGVAFLFVAARTGGPALRLHSAFAAAAVACLALMSIYSSADPRRMAAGVFRSGKATEHSSVRVLDHFDGSTASVTVLKYEDDTVSIITNGKPDASANLGTAGKVRPDEPTMILTAALPLSVRPDARRVAVVGFGAGMSTHTLLGMPGVERVDTIEIERAMYEGARHFGIRSERAYNDPRSHVVFEDAKTFFHQRGEKYDVIVSEPSNPWVSGVSSLFTTEYYGMVRRFLTDDGVLAQWLHAYETDEFIVNSILKALAANFADFQIYATNATDLVIVASVRPGLPLPSDDLFRHETLRRELERIDIRSPADLHMRFLADKAMLEIPLKRDRVPANSDYFPFVDLNAARTLFTRQMMGGLHHMRAIIVPVLFYFRPELFAPGQNVTASAHWVPSELRADATIIAEGGMATAPDQSRFTGKLRDLQVLSDYTRDCEAGPPGIAWEYAMLEATMVTVGYLDADRLAAFRPRIAPACAGELSADQQHLLGLFDGYARRDFGLVADSAGSLLAVKSRYKDNQREFFFASLLVGLANSGRLAELKPEWERWVPELYPGRSPVPYPLVVLYANTGLTPPE